MFFGKIKISTFLIITSIFVLFFLTRLTNILTLPIFTDEAIYVRWSQIAKQDAAWRFISLTDGKQPLFIWIVMNFMRVVDDPLLAGRLASVFAGFGTLIGIMLLSLEIFKKKKDGGILNQIFGHLTEDKTLGYLTGILFVLYPFALVLDRLAIYDSLVACTVVWALYLEVLLVKYLRLDIALLTGIVIGLAILNKTSGFFAIYLFPFSLLLFNFEKKERTKRFFNWVLFVFISVLISYSMYMVLRLSPFFYIIDEKNALFVFPFSEWIKHPIYYLAGNLNALFSWLSGYLSIPVLTLAIVAFLIRGNFREKTILFIWFILPFTGLVLFGKTLYPRFIYFMTMPLLILASYAILIVFKKFSTKIFAVMLATVVIGWYLYADYYIIFNFPRAPIPEADLFQYINSWPAGGGIREMVSFFNKESKKGKIYVGTQGTFGSLPTNSMEIYLEKNKNIETKGFYPLNEVVPEEVIKKTKEMPVYFVLNDSEEPPFGWPVELVAKHRKGIGDRHLSIYKFIPQDR